MRHHPVQDISIVILRSFAKQEVVVILGLNTVFMPIFQANLAPGNVSLLMNDYFLTS
jgi:hypothetical protein